MAKPCKALQPVKFKLMRRGPEAAEARKTVKAQALY
jgi:hypothetical protein